MQNAALKNEEFQKTDTRKVPNILFAGQFQKELYDKHKKTISQQIEDYGFECLKRNWLKVVRLHAKGKATVTAVALAISDHTNRADGLCWPSINTIAKEAGVSRSSVFNALRLLKRRKLLFWPKTESRIKKSNHYILMIDNQYLSLLEGGSAKITLDESRGVVQKLHPN